MESVNKVDAWSGPSSISVMSSMGVHGDNAGVQITTVKLDGTSYLEWCQSAKMYIGGRGKLGFINGCVLEPDASDTQAYEKWDFENLTVMS